MLYLFEIFLELWKFDGVEYHANSTSLFRAKQNDMVENSRRKKSRNQAGKWIVQMIRKYAGNASRVAPPPRMEESTTTGYNLMFGRGGTNKAFFVKEYFDGFRRAKPPHHLLTTRMWTAAQYCGRPALLGTTHPPASERE